MNIPIYRKVYSDPWDSLWSIAHTMPHMMQKNRDILSLNEKEKIRDSLITPVFMCSGEIKNCIFLALRDDDISEY